MDLCQSIEKTALFFKDKNLKEKDFFEIKGHKARIKSVFENSLYEIKQKNDFKNELKEQNIEINLYDFYHQFFIDEEKLKKNINKILQNKSQCTMIDINKEFGITKGIAELIGYISIAKNSSNSIIDENKKILLSISDFDKNKKNISMPEIIFVK